LGHYRQQERVCLPITDFLCYTATIREASVV
jgi:hypothetical protein